MFRHISRLGYPCIPSITIKTEDSRDIEFDILVLANRNIKLVEVTTYGNLKEKVSEKKENRDKLDINQRLPIIFVCDIENADENFKESLYYVPFKELDRIKDYLEKV